jgi:PIN domain nuclease of toxin-antitoxin system
MKSIIIDTHVLIWWLANDPQLGKKALKEIANTANAIFVSSATSWEISIKAKSGKLILPRPMQNMRNIVYREGFYELPIILEHGNHAGQLPLIHKDPFDRMLITQSILEGHYLMTADNDIKKYPDALIIDALI